MLLPSSCIPSRKLTRSKRSPALAIVLTIFVILPCMNGCLSRSAGPTLPYVKPANSVPQVDPTRLQMASRLQDMEGEIQRLREIIERMQASGGNEQAISNLQQRVVVIERRLGLERAAGQGSPDPVARDTEAGPSGQIQPPPGRSGSQSQPPAIADQAAPVEIRNTPISAEEKAYRDAYAAFKNGSLDQSVALFEEFLKKHPKSQYAADAVYWIGEVRFGQGRFDEAVLQYDRVIKEFPGSKKELSALLKQGQAFEKMGDNRSARIIFQKIVNDYPHTAQARAAGGKLKILHD